MFSLKDSGKDMKNQQCEECIISFIVLVISYEFFNLNKSNTYMDKLDNFFIWEVNLGIPWINFRL